MERCLRNSAFFSNELDPRFLLCRLSLCIISCCISKGVLASITAVAKSFELSYVDLVTKPSCEPQDVQVTLCPKIPPVACPQVHIVRMNLRARIPNDSVRLLIVD